MSILRENVIIRMMDAELTAQTVSQRLQTRSAMVPAIDARHLRNFIQELTESAGTLANLMNYDFDAISRVAGGAGLDKVKLVFQSMVQAGIISAEKTKASDLDVTESEKARWFDGFKKITEDTNLGKLH